MPKITLRFKGLICTIKMLAILDTRAKYNIFLLETARLIGYIICLLEKFNIFLAASNIVPFSSIANI